MIFISSFFPWIPIALLVFFYIFKNNPKYNFFIILLYFALLIAVTDSSTSYFFKNLFSRLRPCYMPELKDVIVNFGQSCGGRNGFFSSHAANAVALGTFLMAFANMPSLFNYGIWFLLALISYSRIYLGVHLPMDIIVGCLWGFTLSKLWIYLAKNSLRAPIAL